MELQIIGGIILFTVTVGMMGIITWAALRSAKVNAEHRAQKKARKKEKKRLKKLALANSQTESPSA